MNYIIYYTEEVDYIFVNQPINLNSQQSYVKLTYDELSLFNEYKFRNEIDIKVILNDLNPYKEEDKEKLYITRENASTDPKAFEIFVQDYSILEDNPLANLVFKRALRYNGQTFTQWLKDLDGNPIALNLDGKFFKAIIGSFAYYLKEIPSQAGGISEKQRQNLDFILKPILNFIYMGDWRSAAEYYYLGYDSVKTTQYATGVPSIKSELIADLTNNGNTPEQVSTIMGNFLLFEIQLDSYIKKMYPFENGQPIVVNPNPLI